MSQKAIPKTCKVPNCSKSTIAKGLCMRHYQQQRRGGPLKSVAKASEGKIVECRPSFAGSIDPHNPFLLIMEDGQELTLRLSEFGGDPNGNDFKGVVVNQEGQGRRVEGYIFNDGTGFVTSNEPWELRYIREQLRRLRLGLTNFR
jgi:hypothetical protein